MTQKDKELLLKDLYARLPYGFIVHRYSDNCDITFGTNGINDFAHFLEYSEGEEFKPYLRPMSSMTEEERKERLSFFQIVELNSGLTPLLSALKSFEYINWLNAHHFDYRELIEKGLALQAPEGMYK